MIVFIHSLVIVLVTLCGKSGGTSDYHVQYCMFESAVRHLLYVLILFFVDLTIRSTITEYRPIFAENCCTHKVSHTCKCSSNHCHFFTIVTFIFENRLFFADISVCQRSMLQVLHDKHVHKINSNKLKIYCQCLKFSLKSLLYDGAYKILKFILI